MKRIAIAILTALVFLAPLAPVSAGWGYAQERAVKREARQFVKELRAQGIEATLKFYEDGSWHIVGCVSDGLCQD